MVWIKKVGHSRVGEVGGWAGDGRSVGVSRLGDVSAASQWVSFFAHFEPAFEATMVLSEEYQRVWKWIAYALFCATPSRRRPVQSVFLDVYFCSDKHMQHIREIVSAKDPISLLIKRPASLAKDSICASRFYLCDPKKLKTSCGDISCGKSAKVLHELSVLKRSKTWTTVLLPDLGEAWVHRDNVVAKARAKVGPFVVHAIPQVTLLGVGEITIDPVLDLLCLIGPGSASSPLKLHFQQRIDSISYLLATAAAPS